MAFQQERQARLLSRMGKFDEGTEERGYRNGKLAGQLEVCTVLLTGELVAYIETETGKSFDQLDYEPYMTPEEE